MPIKTETAVQHNKLQETYIVFNADEPDVENIMCMFITEEEAVIAAHFIEEVFGISVGVRTEKLHYSISDWVVSKAKDGMPTVAKEVD